MPQANKFPGLPAHPIKVETDIFARTLRATEYLVDMCEHFGQETAPDLARAARELVANTYIDEQKIFPETKRAALMGRTPSSVASASQRVAVLRRSLDHDEPFAELFATAQIISNQLGGLPIEDVFPELFPDSGKEETAVEVSRLTSRYPASGEIQHLGFISLMRASFAIAHSEGAEAIYAMTEPHVAEIVGSYGLSVEPLGKPKKVQEDRDDLTTLVPLRFDVAEVNRLRDESSAIYSPLAAHYLRGVEFHHGLGFFDADLQKTPGEVDLILR